MKECTEKRKAYSESRRNNRKAKQNNISESNDNDMNKLSKSYEKHMLNTSLSYDKHMENENETVNEIDNINTETEVVYTRPMLERIIDKFISVDSRFKFNSVMIEIEEDYGGFDNLIQMYLPDDTSAQKNFKKQLKQYQNGIFA